ncbi:MAG TPA: DMT family transporter [Candidatus Limnocylindria bacterium]|nr:DMT family transporter [Candidatus Limnocylindria bacterium]
MRPVTVEPPSAPVPALGAPPPRDVALLAVVVAAVSTSGPLVVATAVPALAIAFWRNALGAVAVGGYVATRPRRRAELAGLTRRELRLSGVAGVFLALHFATWIPSLRLTSVASSVALVCLQPVWGVLIARARGHAVPRQAWAGIAIAFGGVLVLTGIDAGQGRQVLLGDLLAIVGGMAAAGYVTVGAEVRRTVSTSPYTLLCYSLCAMLLAGTCLATGASFSGYTQADWARIVLLTILAQLLGHTLANVVLRTTSATVVSLAILLEVPGSIIVAALLLGQVPPLEVLPAVALMLGGIVVVVRAQTPVGVDPEPPG